MSTEPTALTAPVVYQTPEDAPPDVHASLAALKALAASAKSRDDWDARGGRKATPEEIALATLLRAPNACVGHSSRTGLPCGKKRMRGSTVCERHGGLAAQVKAKAERRLALEVMPSLKRMVRLRDQDTHPDVARKAASDLLDRAGTGQLVQAKIAQATQSRGPSGVTVNVGFIGAAPQALIVTPGQDE